MNYATLSDAIAKNLRIVSDSLYAEGLIPHENYMFVPIDSDYAKANKLVNFIEQQLESSFNPEQYLIDICHVLINQQHCTLTDIATSILHQLGECVCTLSVINIVIIS